MPLNYASYSAQAAAIMERMGQTRAMNEINKGRSRAAMAQAVPENAMAMVNANRMAAADAQQQQARALALREGQRREAQSMKDLAEEEAIKHLFLTADKKPDGSPDFDVIANSMDAIDPAKAQAVRGWGDAATQRAAKQAADKAETIAKEFIDADETNWTTKRANLKRQNIDVTGVPETFDPQFKAEAMHAAMSFSDLVKAQTPPPVKTRAVTTKNADGSETTRIVKDAPDQTFTGTAPTPKVTFPRGPETRLVNGRQVDVVMGSDNNWYRPGSTTPIDPATVKLVPKTTTEKGVTFPRGTETRIVNGVETEVIMGSDANWYLPGGKTPLDPSTVKLQPPAARAAGGVTAAGKAEAERWKYAQIADLEKEFKAASAPPDPRLAGITDPAKRASAAAIQNIKLPVPMTAAELDRRKLEIENAYREQIGAKRLDKLPANWTGGTPSAAPPAPAPAPAPVVAPTAVPAPPPSTGPLAVGQTREYKGKLYKVTAIKDGQAELEPLP